jgi:hypothetical protein
MSANMAHITLLVSQIIVLMIMFTSEAFTEPSTAQSNASNTVPQTNLTCVLTAKNVTYHYNPRPYAVADLIILVVTLIASVIVQIARKHMVAQRLLESETNCRNGNYGGGFWDIIREGDYYPSLARFQFIIWTFVISFSLLSIYLLMLWHHTLCWSVLPQNVLALMGISAGVPIVSHVISREKYAKSIAGTLPCKENVPALSTMLLEGKPTIGRYQMFLWTIISVIVYLGLFLGEINGISNVDDLKQLSLPIIDPSLLFLMGLSQAAYLGAKSVVRPVSFLTIVGRYPEQNQRNVKRSTDIVVTFSESLDNTTVNDRSFGVRKHSDRTNVAGVPTVLPHEDKIAAFKPAAELEASTEYDIYIETAIQTKDKRKLENDESWSFETV